MRITVGTTDRALRCVLAAGAVAGAGMLGFTGGWGIALLALAAMMTVTALSGYCLVYSLLGIDTLRRGSASASGRDRPWARRAA